MVVIPNFTDFQSKKHYSEIREKTIIAAGRIAPVKQFDKLIVIWSTLHREFPDWKVKIFGGGDDQLTKELNQLIKKHHLSSSVSLLSSTPHIESEMQRASIYAMTSKTECFPMVLLEAKACGLPIISFDCPTGPKHIVNHGVDGIRATALKLVRDSTAIDIGTASGDRTVASTVAIGENYDTNRGEVSSINFLDSPNTTSAITYKIQVGILESTANVARVNTSGADGNFTYIARSASTITVMEIKG
jgi:glycosyltransferase involved in cell wall biosynthesis